MWHEEDEKDSKTWFLDHNYIDGMYDMFWKVNGVLPFPFCFPLVWVLIWALAKE
jgi:hypothetical protein